MSLDRDTLLNALRSVRYPGFTRDIVSFGIVRDLGIDGDSVVLALDLGAGNPAAAGEIERDVRTALLAAGAARVDVRIGPAGVAAAPAALPILGARPASGPPAPGLGAPSATGSGMEAGVLPQVRHVVAVASGKGGVGKSTVAVNLAVALAGLGARTGLLDADVFGPSIPLMMGTDEKPRLDESGAGLVPFERFGVRFMSLGFLVDKEAAVIWRGPMVMKAVSQLLADVRWGELDVLVVDMPPGTGDTQLTLSQKVRLAGAVIVTTPQDIALADAVKGIAMFRKVGVPILGVVENMSHFSCPHCGGRSEIFGHGGGRREAERLEVPFLGEIPLDPEIRVGGDRGEPAANDPASTRAAAFLELARKVLGFLDLPAAPGTDEARESGGLLARLRRGWNS